MFFTLHEGRRRRRSAVVLRLSNDQRRSANGRQISDRPAESFVFTAGFEDWCGRGDSNPYDIAIASPSSWGVCQFRHFRNCEVQKLVTSRVGDLAIAFANSRTHQFANSTLAAPAAVAAAPEVVAAAAPTVWPASLPALS